MKTQLDFICIGAAKSATTTFFELIKDHPEIAVPSAKEVPYFSAQDVYDRGIEHYMNAHFSGANPDAVWGTVTPQYMIGQGELYPTDVAGRIKKDMPNVKIIALLRHPIERAFSHYKMLYKSGHETRSFEEAIQDIMSGDVKLEGYEDPDSNYLFCSEYGKILSEYYDRLPRKNILILSTEELKNNPASILKKTFNFLGVNENYRPEGLHIQSRKGGSRPRIKLLTPGFLYKIPFVKKIWQNYTPQPLRKRTEYILNLWNTVPDDVQLDKRGSVYRSLVKYFEDDISLLNELSKDAPVWNDWQNLRRKE